MRRLALWSLASVSLALAGGQPPAPLPVPAPAPVAVVVVAPLKYEDACCALKTLPAGCHRMVFLHPYTCCPVEVCFELKCGCFKVECDKGLCARKLRFEFKGCKNDVVIKFHKDGTVTVKD
jgi:hypothetical protein